MSDWDFNETKLTIYFGELPEDQEITLKLPTWWNDMKDIPAGRHPVIVKGETLVPLTLNNGVQVKPHISHEIVFWHGIYEKWRNAPKSNLNTAHGCLLTLVKTGKKKWHILSIKGL